MSVFLSEALQPSPFKFPLCMMDHIKAVLLGGGGSVWKPSSLSFRCLLDIKTLSHPKPQPWLFHHLVSSLTLPCHPAPVMCTVLQFSLQIAVDHVPWPFIACILFNCLFHHGTLFQPYAVASPCSVLQLFHLPSLSLPTQLLPKVQQFFMSSVSSLPSCFAGNF